MHAVLIAAAFAALAAAAPSTKTPSLKILLGNDDGWAEANVREFYKKLKADGHDVVMVAPVIDESGHGGQADYTDSATLLAPGEYNSVPAGAPSIGSDPSDGHIWYYAGTPAACSIVALDYVLPKVWGKDKAMPDLYVGGPNVGQNLGGWLYTLSGTMGGTYTAAGRGVPAVAFSGGSLYGHRSYHEVNKTTKSGAPDPATIYADLSSKIVNALAANKALGKALLPVGYGLNVNFPDITSLDNKSCIAPPFYQTRFTGGAIMDKVTMQDGVFTYGNYNGTAENTCINGDCSLPGETNVVYSGCFSSVSVFSIDYDAPLGADQDCVRSDLSGVVKNYPGHSKRDALAQDAPLRHL